MTYRRDIDGLRAIAVLAVVLYHAGAPWLPGGFLGVDVFFVISGYLITGLIIDRVREGTFSFVDFYERRARRLLPALFAVLAFTTAMALWLLFPLELKELNFHLRGAILFASNFTLAEKTDYFAIVAGSKPVLHTWSLAVEEQFYLVFPPLLILILARGQALSQGVVFGLVALSLGSAIYFAPNHITAAFFMPHFRFWELGVGALLALGLGGGRPRTPLIAGVAGVLGLAAVLAAISPALPLLPVPGLGTAAPVLGTALIIWSGAGPVAWLLSTRPFVALGLISYSLYLWHWPVLVFLGVWLDRQIEGTEAAIAVAVSFVLAILSWRFIEQPVRHRRVLATRGRLFTFCGVAALALIAVTLVGDWTNGLPQRFSERTARALSAQDAWLRGTNAACLRRAPRMIETDDPDQFPGIACKIGDPEAPIDFILWGDSHASALQPALETAAKTAGRRGLVFTHSSCAPLPGYPRNAASTKMKGCARFNTLVRDMLRRGEISTVVLGARWRAIEPEDAGLLEDLIAGLTADGMDVIKVGQVPEFPFDVPATVARSLASGRDLPTVRTLEEARENTSAAAAMCPPGACPAALRIDPVPWLCPDGLCPVTVGDDPLYADRHHLSVLGAHYLLDPLVEALEATRPDR
ncbi:MAG: acyltransferase family protein [Pseudomonadota bacterium]